MKGVSLCPKHLVCNTSELRPWRTLRFTTNPFLVGCLLAIAFTYVHTIWRKRLTQYIEYTILLKHVFNAGINGKTWGILCNWYSETTCSVKVNNSLSPLFTLERGVKQGSILVYNPFTDLLLETIYGICWPRIEHCRTSTWHYGSRGLDLSLTHLNLIQSSHPSES